MSTLEKLLSPISIGTMELKNRVAMAPMATNWANSDGTMSEIITDIAY